MINLQGRPLLYSQGSRGTQTSINTSGRDCWMTWKQLLAGSTPFTHTDLNNCGWRLFGLGLVGFKNYDSPKENGARTESFSSFDCWAEVCRVNSMSDPNTCSYRRIKSCWIMASPPMNHHLRLTTARGDYCLPSRADEQLWEWKQRHFFLSFSLHLQIEKPTANRRAVMLSGDALLKGQFICSKLSPMTQFMI